MRSWLIPWCDSGSMPRLPDGGLQWRFLQVRSASIQRCLARAEHGPPSRGDRRRKQEALAEGPVLFDPSVVLSDLGVHHFPCTTQDLIRSLGLQP
mmetsp:Transcript_2395/g.5095  ORF Transcript_2395/g.5095 Transcript_2395/m.5095 type:complete len:95 (-) Transcript_2395:133-417(-)